MMLPQVMVMVRTWQVSREVVVMTVEALLLTTSTGVGPHPLDAAWSARHQGVVMVMVEVEEGEDH